MSRTLDMAKDFRDELVANLTVLVDTVPLLIPIDNIDKKILNIGVDMLKTLKTDLEDAQTVGELSRYINLTKLEDNWDELRRDVINIDANEVRRRLSDILDTYMIEEGDD